MTSFEPFLILPRPLRSLKKIRSRSVLSVVVVGAVGLALINVFQGTLGGWSDLRPAGDIGFVFGLNRQTRPTPNFPLLRDVSSWVMGAIMLTTCALVHRQWRILGAVLSDLESNKVLIRRDAPTFSRSSRILRHDRKADNGDPPTIDTIVQRINVQVERIGDYTFLLAGATGILVFLLLRGQERLHIFEFLSPYDHDTKANSLWLADSYSSWWASSDHTAGQVAYAGIAAIGFFVIILQNIIGCAAIYGSVAIPSFYEMDVNWYALESNRGWKPIAKAFQTVRWSLGLHGMALAILMTVCGIDTVRWIMPLFLMWVLACLIFTLVPWRVFRRVQREALERLVDRSRSDPITLRDVGALEAARGALIRPLRLTSFQFYGFALAVAFPILVAVVQFYASVKAVK